MVLSKFINFEDSIFIAGHKGMVGKAVFKKLAEKGYKNLVTCEKNNLDLQNAYDVDDFFNRFKPSVVVLCAAKVGGILANNSFPAEFILNNLMIQTNVIRTAYKSNVKRFLFLGSSCIYPKQTDQPIKEEYLLNGNLESTNEYYAIAKIAGLKLCEALYKQYGFDAISLMPTNLYGTGDNYNLQNSHVFPALIRKFCEAKKDNFKSVICWGDGTPLREFLHCDDLADACLYVLENVNSEIINKNLGNNNKLINHINVGSGKDISIKDLAELISKEVDYKGEILWDSSKPNGTHQKKLDINLMRKLGWQQKISLKEGIKKTVKEFRENYFL